MSSCLTNLPPEIFEKIIKYLAKADRTNLSCANKDSNKRLKPLLWKKVSLRWELLHTSPNFLWKCLDNLKYTKSITIDSGIDSCTHIGYCYFDRKNCLKLSDLKDVIDRVTRITCENVVTLQYVTYVFPSFVDQYLLEHLSKFLNLQNICFQELKFMDNEYSLKGLESIPSLKNLSLIKCSLKPSNVKDISKQTMLRTLNLNHCEFSEEFGETDYEILQSLNLLEMLQLRKCSFVDDTTMEFIAENFQCLRRLDVSNCFQISDVGVKNISKLLELESFEFCFNLKITNLSLPYLETMTDRMKRLGGSGTSLSIFLPFFLEKCQVLEHFICTSSLPIDLESICKFGKTLKTLNIHDCYLFWQDKYFKDIGNLANLRKLDLSMNGINDHCLLSSQIENLVHLKVLDIGDNDISDWGVHILASAPLLRILSVEKNEGVTQQCVSSLIHFPFLECLYILGTSINSETIVRNDNNDLIKMVEDVYVDNEYLYDVEIFGC